MMILKRIYALLLVWVLVYGSVVLAAVPPTASHYLQDALIDGRYVQRWNDQTRPVYVTIYTGKQIPGWNPAMVQSVRTAFFDWQKAIGGRVKFYFTSNPKLTDIQVFWRKYPQGYRIGHQDIVWRNNVLVHAGIEIAVYNVDDKPFTSDEVKNIALHEIGHALGIRGHSSNPADIMYPTTRGNITKLSSRDIRTVLELYKRPPDITNPAGVHLGSYRHYENQVATGVQNNLKNNHAESYNNFKQALASNPNDPNSIFLVGIGAYNMKKYDEAITHLTKLVKTNNPHRASATFYLAQSLLITGHQMVEAGDKRNGLSRILQADKYYAQSLQNKSLPNDLRKIAVSQRSLIKQHYLSKMAATR